jgi:tetratricopeptide (TPR) repeat protein
MSNKRRTFALIIAGAALAALAAVAWIRLGNRPGLPGPAHYANLPRQFGEALQAARERAGRGNDSEAVRALARLYQANRLFAEARACYRVVASNPQGLAARDHYYLALIALDESDTDTALAELRATLAAEPGYIPARVALADSLFRSGQADAAQKEYEGALQVEKEQPQALLGLARVALQRRDDGAAVARLQELVARHPESTSGPALLAQVLERKGEAEEAAVMTALSKQKHEPLPADPWAKALLADCYDLARLGIAFEEYRLSEQMDEALPLVGRLEELDPKGWTAPMLRGWSQKEAGHYPEAVREYRLALANGADPQRICPLLVNALLSEKNTAEAASLLAEYHAKLPNSIPILLSYCEVAVREKDDKLARSLLSQVLQAEPYLYMPNMSMVQILWNGGERDLAAGFLRRVAKVYPADVDSRGLLGQYYMEKGDPLSAIAPLEQALSSLGATDPRRAQVVKMLDTAYLTAGSLGASSNRFGMAVTYAEKSIKLVPDEFRGYALKANACRSLGDVKGLEQALERMAALQPDNPKLQMDLGDALLQVGDRDQARAHWRRALELAPPDASGLRDDLAMRLSAGATP